MLLNGLGTVVLPHPCMYVTFEAERSLTHFLLQRLQSAVSSL